MIRCTQLTRLYRTPAGEVQALAGVDLAVRAGEFVAVRGPSGCGKTTLLLTLGGMLRPTAGRVEVARCDLGQLSAGARAQFRAEQIGFVFQMFHLVPYLSVRENVLLAPCTLPAAEAATRVSALLEQFGLASRAAHKPGALSAGERQRCAIARALLNRPRLILADEPTGNLDPANADEVFRHLQQYQRDSGTVLLVTHGGGAEQYAQRIVQMEGGRIVA